MKNLYNGYILTILPFQKNSREKINELLELGDLDKTGLQEVYDGQTGDKVGNLCVGYQYMLKLCHMAKDKIHSRSTGPYSLITQQPLCGKSNDGGQRVGEMECWALQAYGAAFIQNEMTGIKSDKIKSRYEAFKSMVNGDDYYKDNEISSATSIFANIIRSMGMNFEFQKGFNEDEEIDSYINYKEEKSINSKGDSIDVK